MQDLFSGQRQVVDNTQSQNMQKQFGYGPCFWNQYNRSIKATRAAHLISTSLKKRWL